MTTGDSNTTLDGGCVRHPFIQLRCRSRTGDWKTLLDSCPLCAADGASVGSNASASSVPGGATPAPPRGRERTASPVRRRSRGRSVSRVRFPSAGKEAQRLSVSVPPGGKGRAPKALKDIPKYKECKEAMQRQLDESEKQKVTFMSEDLSLGMSEDLNLSENFWNSVGVNDFDDAGAENNSSVLSGEIPTESRQEHSGRNSRRPDHANGVEKEAVREELTRMLSVELEDKKEKMDKKPARKMETKLRNSVQLQKSRMLLPEDYQAEERSVGSGHSGGSSPRERGAGSSLGSAGSKSSSRRSRSHSRKPSGDVPSQRGRSLGWPRAAAKVSPDPEEFPCHGPTAAPLPSREGRRLPPPPPPARPPRQQAPPSDATTPPAFRRMPLEPVPGGGPPPLWQDLIVTPGGADEVSLLSSPSAAANSVTTGSTDNSRGSRYRHDQGDLEEDPLEDMEEEDDDESRGGEVTDPATTLINTADYDSKGRCIHHPHVRLRKKKMFGRGWKTLMSACPDCCMEELRRVVDNKKQELAMKKLERTTKNKGSLDRSHRSEGSDDRGRHIGARSVGSLTNNDDAAPGTRRPSAHSSSLPLQPALATHTRREPSQESFRSAPVPARTLTRSRSKRSPSQDTYRSAPTSRRLPSQDSFRNGSANSGDNGNMQRPQPPPPKKKTPGIAPSDRTTSTTSLTASEELSGSVTSRSDPSTMKIVPLQAPKTRSRSSSSRPCKSSDQSPVCPYGIGGAARSATPPAAQPAAAEWRGAGGEVVPQVGIIHVRDMKWTDANGNSGRYTGQVNAQFVPHGHGSAVFDLSNKTKQGEWKDGKHLRSSRTDENSNGGAPPFAPRSRSRSRTGEDGRRPRSRGRSTSRSMMRQRSVSRQPRPLVAAQN